MLLYKCNACIKKQYNLDAYTDLLDLLQFSREWNPDLYASYWLAQMRMMMYMEGTILGSGMSMDCRF